mmetsp:Transcript_25634/g.64401  ORF Transcript_25634/g.64401 Transcript_25634/m.64401 type:complete len:91 (-) Transcript_25634:2556-2828(-)
MASRCFVCGIDSSVFQRKAKGFRYHVSQEHCIWDYLFLRMYLKEKDSVDYTAQETYIDSLMKRSSLDFFPVGKSLYLLRQSGGANEEVDE